MSLYASSLRPFFVAYAMSVPFDGLGNSLLWLV